jgi:hypothetical protein
VSGSSEIKKALAFLTILELSSKRNGLATAAHPGQRDITWMPTLGRNVCPAASPTILICTNDVIEIKSSILGQGSDHALRGQ